jgi:hypothetical protein
LKNNNAALANAIVSLKQPEPEPYKGDIGKPISRSDDGFDEFWQAVPRKVAKAKAKAAYAAAIKHVDSATILGAMRRYAESRKGQDVRYTAHPATWLADGRWSDDQAEKSTEAAVDLKFYADWVNGDKPLFGAVKPSLASALINAGLVTADRAKSRGVL